MAIEMDILEKGLKAVRALEVQNLQAGRRVVLTGYRTAGEEFEADRREVAVRKPALDGLPIWRAGLIASPGNNLDAAVHIDIGRCFLTRDMRKRGQPGVPI